MTPEQGARSAAEDGQGRWKLGLRKVSVRRLAGRASGKAAWELKRKLGFDEFHHLLADKAEEYAELRADPIFAGLPFLAKRFYCLSQLVGTGLCEAMFLAKYVHKALALEGDVCEFGVGSGATSAFLANEVAASDRTLWLFDSFEGLPRPSPEDTLVDDINSLGSIHAYAGKMRHSPREARWRLSRVGFPPERVRLVHGAIEHTITAEFPDKVCFAYVDFDFYEPITVALEHLDATVVKGGHIIVDDYGYFSSGAKASVDEFLGRRPHYDADTPSRCPEKFIILHKKM